jgi:hypothetical protein
MPKRLCHAVQRDCVQQSSHVARPMWPVDMLLLSPHPSPGTRHCAAWPGLEQGRARPMAHCYCKLDTLQT